MKLVEIILEIFGWLTIVFSATACCALIAFGVFFVWPNDSVKILGLILIIIGFLGGVFLATRIWKKYGTIEWLSGIRRIS